MKERKQDHFGQLLKDNGLKITPQRLKILQLFSGEHIILSAEDAYKKMKNSGIDRATIYRTLASLKSKGILERVDLHKDSIYYELALHHHHHLICMECGMTEGFDACDLEATSNKILKKSQSFENIREHSLELFGMCRSCAKN